MWRGTWSPERLALYCLVPLVSAILLCAGGEEGLSLPSLPSVSLSSLRPAPPAPTKDEDELKDAVAGPALALPVDRVRGVLYLHKRWDVIFPPQPADAIPQRHDWAVLGAAGGAMAGFRGGVAGVTAGAAAGAVFGAMRDIKERSEAEERCLSRVEAPPACSLRK